MSEFEDERRGGGGKGGRGEGEKGRMWESEELEGGWVSGWMDGWGEMEGGGKGGRGKGTEVAENKGGREWIGYVMEE